MRDAGVKRFIFLVDVRGLRRAASVPIVETLDTQPINAYGETKLTIERALPHSSGARDQVDRAAVLQRRGRMPDGTIGEDHADEIHLIPLAIRAANGGTPLKVFGEDYPTPDGTCLRDYIHVCDLADAHIRALEALERGAPSARLQHRHRHSAVGPVGDRDGQPGARPAGGMAICAAPAGRSCGTLCSQ
jgi:UDP-glucose 4-epimerase